tara:strand:- start:420 stop:764 length:345 start_codon:yes stop_codon:yes gene_type:complete
MRAILINPFDETITEVEYSGDFRQIYELTDCSTFDVVMLCNTDDLYVDDEGLLKDNRYFSWSGRNFAGKGLILAHDEEGETIPTTYDLQEVIDRVEWLPEGHQEVPYMEFVSWS